MMQNTAEYQRIAGQQREKWHRWGTYVGGRAWGNVRESGPTEEKPWVAFPFEHARSRTYRWTEDGIGGFSDDQQHLCMAVALWNEQDPYLKERYFGLGNEPGNHGEGIKDYFFFLDGVPSHSYAKMLYKYPHVQFPYERLYRENLRRGQDEAAFELIDALENTFHGNHYFDIFIEYAKADPDDILCRITAVNRGSEPAPLHLLPHLWFRNTWQHEGARPELRAEGDALVRVLHDSFGERWWSVDTAAPLLFTENETNNALMYDQPNRKPYVKDGIDSAVVRGQRERVNPEKSGTKCAADVYALVEAGGTWVVRTRFQPNRPELPFADFDAIFEQRRHEADAYYAALQKDDLTPEVRDIQRRAFGALCWNKNFYHFNVDQWLNENRLTKRKQRGKSKPELPVQHWRHFEAHDVLSLPDIWEYPWFATWDLDFQVVTAALIDPEFAKQQVLLLLNARYMRSDGAMPAFEGDLITPHPPIHAWATWHVYQMTGKDTQFLARAYRRLKKNYAWWLKTQNQGENYLFGGGFLGMDNISIFDRSHDVPKGGWLAQADGTGWMALFSLHLLAMAIELGQDEDAVDFLKSFISIRKALLTLWHEETQFLYDLLYTPETGRMALKVRSLVGLVPLTAVLLLDPARFKALPQFRNAVAKYRAESADFVTGKNGCYLLSALSPEKIRALLQTVFDEAEFYSAYGIRSLSKYHLKHPVTYKIGDKSFELTYDSGESSKKMFGGNSNWRGPIWAPLNQLMIEALHYYHDYFGDDFVIEGAEVLTLEKAAFNLASRLISLFQRDAEGSRPVDGDHRYFQTDPHWRDYFWFYEHFHAETGEGLGASHQNGWTALIAKLIQNEGREVFIPAPRKRKGDAKR